MKTIVKQSCHRIAFTILLGVLSISAYTPAQILQERVKRGMWKGEEIEYVDRQVSIKVKPGVSKAQLTPAVEMLRSRFLEEIDVLRWTVIELPERTDVFDAISVLEKNPLIEKAIPVGTIYAHVLPNDPYFRGTSPATYPHQWGLRNMGQSPPGGTAGADIKAEDAWDITTGSSNVLLAILDSGIPLRASDLGLSHPDLNDANKIILRADYTGDGQSVRDRNGHGTHVAGIAAAMTNNGEGIARVAWNSRILVYQVFDSVGSGPWSAFRNATRDAVDYQRNNLGVKVVINFSGGGGTSRNEEAEDAVSYANQHGVLMVISAGNTHPTRNPDTLVEYPARYSLTYSNVIAVAATDHNDNRATYSGRGSALNVSAPGGYGGSPSADDIFSTTPNYPFYWESQGVGRTYGYMSGTSMAAPHVAGTAALLLSVNSSLTPSQIRNTLQLSADDKGTVGFDTLYGHGRINANKAVRNLYVPQVYATIQEALNVAKSGQTVVVAAGNYSYSSNLTIPSGITLQLNYGVTLSFTGYYKLTVNGSLVANGATLQGNGTSGSWFGIEVNNWASTQVNGWTIKDAQYGILLTNNNLAYLASNSLRNNSYGVYVSNYSDPTFIQNGFTGNVLDVFGDNTSVPDFGSAPGSGYNSFRSGQQVSSWYPGTIFAMYNWWGSYPPTPNVSPNVDYSNALSYDPNPSLRIVPLSTHNLLPQAKVAAEVTTTDESLSALNRAHRLYVSGNYAQALAAFEAVVARFPLTFAAKRAVVFIERCLERLNRSSDILSTLQAFSQQHGASLLGPFLETRKAEALARSGQYARAFEQIKKVLASISDTLDHKLALYNAGHLAWYYLNDKTAAEGYFRELIRRYPSDALARSALVTLEPGNKYAVSKRSTNEAPIEETYNAGLLLQNYPNPFNPSTVIRFTLSEAGHTSLKVFDLLGREVATLVNEHRTAGSHQVVFDASALPSGMYFYRLEAAGVSAIQKMVLVR